MTDQSVDRIEEPLSGWRGALFATATATGLWRILPGRIQVWLCNCSICRGVA